MKEFRLKFLPSAANDVRNIVKYLKCFYPSTPKKFTDLLYRQISTLKAMPSKHEKYADLPFYRKMPVGEYLVFYHIDDEFGIVEIHRILHGTKNIHLHVK